MGQGAHTPSGFPLSEHLFPLSGMEVLSKLASCSEQLVKSTDAFLGSLVPARPSPLTGCLEQASQPLWASVSSIVK